MTNHKWTHGQKAALASKAGISRQYLSDILHRRVGAPIHTAKALAAAAKKLRIAISLLDFIDAKETTNPLFEGAPINE